MESTETKTDFNTGNFRAQLSKARAQDAATAEPVTIRGVTFMVIPAQLDLLLLAGRLPGYLTARIAGVAKANAGAGEPDTLTAALIAQDMTELGTLHRIMLENFVIAPKLVFEQRELLQPDEAHISEIPLDIQTDLVKAVMDSWGKQRFKTEGGQEFQAEDLLPFRGDADGQKSPS